MSTCEPKQHSARTSENHASFNHVYQRKIADRSSLILVLQNKIEQTKNHVNNPRQWKCSTQSSHWTNEALECAGVRMGGRRHDFVLELGDGAGGVLLYILKLHFSSEPICTDSKKQKKYRDTQGQSGGRRPSRLLHHILDLRRQALHPRFAPSICSSGSGARQPAGPPLRVMAEGLWGRHPRRSEEMGEGRGAGRPNAGGWVAEEIN